MNETIGSKAANFMGQLFLDETIVGYKNTKTGQVPILRFEAVYNFVTKGEPRTWRRINAIGEFLLTGTYEDSTRDTLPYAEKPIDIIAYDENDNTVKGLITACINHEIFETERPLKYDPKVDDESYAKYKQKYSELAGANNAAVRKHFAENFLYTDLDNFHLNDYSYFIHQALKIRFESWKDVPKNKPIQEIVSNASKKEKVVLEEEYAYNSDELEQDSRLWEFLETTYNKENREFAAGMKYKDILGKAFNVSKMDSISSINSSELNSFLKVFRDSSLEKAATLSTQYVDKLIDKMYSSGLLRLASYAKTIEEFGRQRLASLESAKKSANDALKPERDTAWLLELSKVLSVASRDPILLSIIYSYFPSLITFFFDAVAVTADYSNGGVGGGKEDAINSLDEFLKSFEKALGVGVNVDKQTINESVFRLVRDGKDSFANTARRIKEALDSYPLRRNIAPRSPDVFHLRIGASNFYVPPLTIDINTSFRTGSLTGGALRQKSSPKFNSGYKETSIRMRLFFPNYEEIWGISIDDASKIILTENYEIDFKTDGSSDEKIDKFLSSLRGLIAAFKYSPFLPIRNHYLNTVYGITGVALHSISVSTVPNFPFALAVDIELLNFNHKPFLPMINDFNQAIHWGKYRQYMGRAAGDLHRYVNSSFLMKTSESKNENEAKTQPKNENEAKTQPNRITVGSGTYDVTQYGASKLSRVSAYENDVITTNIVSEWMDGKNISFFVPAETQTKIFLPDTTSFRTDQEKAMKDYNQEYWQKLLGDIGIDINQSSDYGMNLTGVYNLSTQSTISPNVKYYIKSSIDFLTAGLGSRNTKLQVYAQIAIDFISENGLSGNEAAYIKDYNAQSVPAGTGPRDYSFQGQDFKDKYLSWMKQYLKELSAKAKNLLDAQVKSLTDKQAKKANIDIPDQYKNGSKQYKDLYDNIREQVKQGFNLLIYEQFFNSSMMKQLLEAARLRSGTYLFKEWEVPMLQIDLDPTSVVVKGVTCSISNNFGKMQLQMQDEPTYQHIGGGDTNINISITVVGEKELNKIKRVFDHVNALARLEHSTGVLGFMGIKNIITALCGVKYVVPSNFSAVTIPGYPHVYDINISLIDFDIFQQNRERLDSSQQRDLIKEFSSKRNPFLRIKQMWGQFNTYPDFPLDIKDKQGKIVGHLDPDFYFRSFDMFDKDIIYNISQAPKEIRIPTKGANIVEQTKQLLDLPIVSRILEFLRLYPESDYIDKNNLKKSFILDLKNFMDQSGASVDQIISLFSMVINNPNLVNSSNPEERKLYGSIQNMLKTEFIQNK
jgi:hypothetical protein